MTHVLKPNFPQALRYARRARGKSQEALDAGSGRTYVSALERGIKQPTIGKIAELASALDIHPLTLMTLSYLKKPTALEVQRLLHRVSDEVAALAGGSSAN